MGLGGRTHPLFGHDLPAIGHPQLEVQHPDLEHVEWRQLETGSTNRVSLLVGEPRSGADAERCEEVLCGKIRRIHSGGFGKNHREQMRTATAIVETRPRRIDERFFQNVSHLIRSTEPFDELRRVRAQPAPFMACGHRQQIVDPDRSFVLLKAFDHRAEKVCQRLFGALDQASVDSDSNER